MAQSTLLMFNGALPTFKTHSSLQSQIQRLVKPNNNPFLQTPLLHSKASSPLGLGFTTVALFKAKAKAPAKKETKSKPKLKVEDGVFGTSGGIGFTKQNELFVGRVAMIGFAASILGEAVTGKGILAQLNLETGIPIYEAEPLLLFFILFTLLGAIGALGDRGRFVDDPPTGLEKAVIPPGKGLRSAFGLSEGGPLFGFTKSNELFVGRLAQLGFAFSLIGEIITGKGALAQLNIETGVPINEIEPLVLFNVIFFFFAALNPGTGKFVTDDEED
uniref:Photosystem II 22 kDa protein, chloroplastic n=1 Tax=Sedum alfredii TaxID=439688 RepID=G0Z384_9MAGN|nr:chloroplast photosystem II subunit [Sedum alfredii]